MGSASPVPAHAMDSGSEHAVAVRALCGASRYALAQEGHKEAEADEDHHMDVLIEWVVLRDCNVRTLAPVLLRPTGQQCGNPNHGMAPLRARGGGGTTRDATHFLALRRSSECRRRWLSWREDPPSRWREDPPGRLRPRALLCSQRGERDQGRSVSAWSGSLGSMGRRSRTFR